MTDQNADALCVIPARGGSKRIPRKNVRTFAGMPLIARSIATALASQCFARIVVSTDDEEIAAIAMEHGAEAPFRRSRKLADDFTTTASVVSDAISRLDGDYPFTCCLYPTAPLLGAGHLIAAYQKLRRMNAPSVVAVTEFDFPPMRAFSVDSEDRVAFRFPEFSITRHQDLPRLLHDAGSFYWLKTSDFVKSGELIMAGTVGYEIDRLHCVDIDTEDDWRFAEQLSKFLKSRESNGGT